MPRRNELGDLRRSQIITTYGPGAIIDFRAGGHGGAPVSAVAAGLDQWDERAEPAGLSHPQTIFEPRLQQQLKVDGFRLPPVTPQAAPGQPVRHGGSLVAVRFPEWLQCPECHRITTTRKWNCDPGDPALYCGACTARAPGGRRIHVVPVRFITACENGHLDEFPWHSWIGHTEGCSNKGDLILEGTGSAGLSGLVIRCSACGNSRSMEGCFRKDALQGFRCRGRRPWLAAGNENCDLTPRVLQRGASNLYFPVIVSALDIPPWSDRIQRRLGVYWEDLVRTRPDERLKLIELLGLAEKLGGMTSQEVLEEVNQRIAILENQERGDLRWEEYLQLTRTERTSLGEDTEFEIRPEVVPPELGHWLGAVVRVTRLREVRALLSFTRIRPPAGPEEVGGTARFAAIQVQRRNWLPAVEVRGEGIFLRLNPTTLASWESLEDVKKRAGKVDEIYSREWERRYGTDEKPSRRITPRLLLLHSLAHALIRQLSLECGYSTASLRERIYEDSGDRDMAGILVYTATPDSDGTLGGLARQGRPRRVNELFESTLRSIEWCSSDPLCITGVLSFSEPLNPAACHSCMLAPETSCEEFNRLLDRALLVGGPHQPSLGYFRNFLDK